VPDTCPVEVFSVMPAGSAGDTDHDEAGDPELVGSSEGIAVPFTTDTVDGLYEIDGATSVHVTEVVAVSWFEVSTTLSVPAVDAV
jgi:hypothetical protein